MTEREILYKAYKAATKIKRCNVSKNISNDIDIMVDRIENNKSLVSAIVTSIIKKIANPTQDIRLHRADFVGGYNARGLDTMTTTPFFKDIFPRFANKESSFLTPSMRDRIKWTKKDGKNLKIKDEKLKVAFLNIFDQIENHKIKPNEYLKYLLLKLMEASKAEKFLFAGTKTNIKSNAVLNIMMIISMLSEHFQCKSSSRLPVIAIYSIYEILMKRFERYKNKKLKSLQVHTSSDKHSYGDIEIYSKMNKPFEVVEIKHNKAIDKYLVLDIAKKTHNSAIDRYYILTTFDGVFVSKKDEIRIIDMIADIKKSQGIDIITNGIITTLKYYLRFIDNYDDFLTIYTKNLINDAKNSMEIKDFHIHRWNEIVNKFADRNKQNIESTKIRGRNV